MKRKIKRNLSNEAKLQDELAKYKHKCEKCGHKMIIIKKQYEICNYCGSIVFRDEKAKFKYKLGGMRCIY